MSLFNAAKNDDYEMVKKLIDEGADVNSFIIVFDDGHEEFDETMNEFTPLMIAAHYGNKEICELLIEKGADVNKKGGLLNDTPLLQAIDSTFKQFNISKFQICKLLIEKGADINYKNKFGLSPLNSGLIYRLIHLC